MPADVTDLTAPAPAGPGDAIRTAARARRPRCWCGCPEARHRLAKHHARRSCKRCKPIGCPAYLPCNEGGARVEQQHHIARARSDQQVRANLEALSPLARDVPGPALVRIPHQRGTTLRRSDV